MRLGLGLGYTNSRRGGGGSAGWDIPNATFVQSVDSPDVAIRRAISVSDDGTHMILGDGTKLVYYTMTGGDISTLSKVREVTPSAGGTNYIQYANGGSLAFWAASVGSGVHFATLASPYVIPATLTSAGSATLIGGDGFYVTENIAYSISNATLYSTPLNSGGWDITDQGSSSSIFMNGISPAPSPSTSSGTRTAFVKPDLSLIGVTDTTGDAIITFSMDAGDISTLAFEGSLITTGDGGTDPWGWTATADGTNIYTHDYGANKVLQYSS